MKMLNIGRVLTISTILLCSFCVKQDPVKGSLVTVPPISNMKDGTTASECSLVAGCEIRDGLTPLVILNAVKTLEKRDSIQASWIGDIRVVYGAFTAKGAHEVLVISSGGTRCAAEGYCRMYLLRYSNSAWEPVLKVGIWTELQEQFIDVDGDSVQELFVQGYKGTGGDLIENLLLSIEGGEADTLYFNPYRSPEKISADRKQGIGYRVDTCTFIPSKNNGALDLQEMQTIHVGDLLGYPESAGKTMKVGRFKTVPGDTLIVTTQYELVRGKYRKTIASADTTFHKGDQQ